MKRLQLVECLPEDGERYAEMVERDNGPYCEYAEANSIIGDLRRRLEEANRKLANYKSRGYDDRYPYSERMR